MEGLPRTSMVEKYDMVQVLQLLTEYHSSKEGLHMESLIRCLNEIAKELCELHDISCCNELYYKHLSYQCKCNSNSIIASYQKNKFMHIDIKLVEQFVAFFGAFEVDSLIDEKYETCDVARKHKSMSSSILKYCIENFKENAYVVDFYMKALAAQESTNILQEGDDENLSLGMSPHTQEEEIKSEDEREQEKEEGDPSPSLSKDDSNQIQNSFVIYENPCYLDDNLQTENTMVIYENPCYYEIIMLL
jgi:hypothetical protein